MQPSAILRNRWSGWLHDSSKSSCNYGILDQARFQCSELAFRLSLRLSPKYTFFPICHDRRRNVQQLSSLGRRPLQLSLLFSFFELLQLLHGSCWYCAKIIDSVYFNVKNWVLTRAVAVFSLVVMHCSSAISFSSDRSYSEIVLYVAIKASMSSCGLTWPSNRPFPVQNDLFSLLHFAH